MKKINIIGMPMKYGCFVSGADMAYDALKETLNNIFLNKVMNRVDDSLSEVIEYENGSKIRYVKPVMELSNRLYRYVYDSHMNDEFPLIIGGDHSTAIGSIAADLDYYEGDVSVIWIDAHTDIHNDITTPSGNIHGMPLSILIGRCSSIFNIGKHKLKPTNIYYIGLRNYEIEEITYIKDNNITHYMYNEINDNIIEDIISKINTKYVHISFDFDVLSDDEFHAVNVRVKGNYQTSNGVSLMVANNVLRKLLYNLNVCTIDTVEYNPILDENNECLSKTKVIYETISEYLK